MDFIKGDFILIDNIIKNYRFIGEVIGIINNNKEYLLLLFKYLFPDDTKDGRKSYMSNFEVFLTGEQIKYNVNKNEKDSISKVKVVSLDEYINKKYINPDFESPESAECPLYFKRQNYSPEKNIYDPAELPFICFCNQIFNPDIPFQISKYNHIYHLNCLLQYAGIVCYFSDCDFNCQENLDLSQQFLQLLNAFDINDNCFFNNNSDNSINNNSLSMPQLCFEENPNFNLSNEQSIKDEEIESGFYDHFFD